MIAHFELKTWAGRLAWAIHFYGSVTTGSGNREDITRILTAEQAKELNDLDTCDAPLRKAGDETTLFLSDRSVIDAALEKWKELGLKAEVLLMGNHCTCDPLMVLDGPEEIMEVGNRIHQDFDENDGWEGDEEIAQRLADEWDDLMEPYREWD